MIAVALISWAGAIGGTIYLVRGAIALFRDLAASKTRRGVTHGPDLHAVPNDDADPRPDTRRARRVAGL